MPITASGPAIRHDEAGRPGFGDKQESNRGIDYQANAGIPPAPTEARAGAKAGGRKGRRRSWARSEDRVS